MIAILSSAKTMDFETPGPTLQPTLPECLEQACVMMKRLSTLSANDISKLMGVSPKIAQLNADRFKRFSFTHTPRNAKPALLAYQGAVYQAIESRSFGLKELKFAQKRLRIISGLYGVLRPLDLIQPYRLEMAIKMPGPTWKDLYGYWSNQVTACIDRDAMANGRVIVNLASQEYSRVLEAGKIKARVLDVIFKQDRKGKVAVVPILAKFARGLMANYIVTRQITEPEGLKRFQAEGYRFIPADSTASEWAFIRRASE